ncbi:hypothetical protein [Polaribacter glomeratus]|uniref:Uncharacterized protein n=1 Tax=Polaribacter glomeratus TaxID=102 RepID=A0A2S7WGY0_9FLAO|nr:hypothetical protein [Polaribacter glomeratus]PQJ76874.1 hypothetical protein BTO16_13465 [Polaribacter glomeratus]TXD67284.1 hypothetical protein ESX12_01450 [Polaribacter glomeratus]
MELTTEQLQKVEDYLNLKDITYIDLRMEVFDHIISDIEVKLVDENVDFETIFYLVTDIWDKHLKQSSSFYFGVAYTAPKIVIDKAKKYFKKWFFLILPTYFIPYFIIVKTNTFFTEIIKNSIHLFFQIVTVLSFMFFLLLLFKKYKNEKKTTYSFILKTQSLNALVGFLFLINLNFLDNDGFIDASKSGILMAFIFSTYSYFHFYKKHLEAIKKHKIS